MTTNQIDINLQTIENLEADRVQLSEDTYSYSDDDILQDVIADMDDRITAGVGVTLSNATPLVESGAGDAGTGTEASRDDHVHPDDGGGGGGGSMDPSTEAFIYEELFSPSTTVAATEFFYAGACFAQPSGTGATVSRSASEAGHPGIFNCLTGTTTTGHGTFASGGSSVAIIGGGVVRWSAVLRPSTLSNGTNTYTIRSGWCSALNANGTEAIMFRYTDSVNSGNWEAVCRNSNAETVISSSVPVASATWVKLSWEANSAGTEVEFFIDDVSIGTINTNVPTTGMRFLPLSVVKSAGTNARGCEIDAYWATYTVTR